MGDASVQLVIISGRSGSGKTVALRALEDLGYYCIDNLPVMFLKELTEIAPQRYPRLAVSIDIRNIPEDDSYLESIFNNIKSDASIHSTLIFCDADDQVLVKRYSETRRLHPLSKNNLSLEDIFNNIKSDASIHSTLIFCDADDQVLVKRYSETRRLHPLSKNNLSLEEAILLERTKLAGISGFADLRIDTSELSVHSLSNEIVTAIIGTPEKRLVMVFESFGFKNGIAKDADFVFDARFLPNPFWEKELRSFTGLDQPVKDFFARYPEVDAYVDQIDNLLSSWLHAIESSNRSYLTVSVGCTGGCHRSVYIAQKLADLYHSRGLNVQVRHRSLNINSRLSNS